MRQWSRRWWRWRLIRSWGWIRPAYRVRLLLVWVWGPHSGSLALVNEREWQRGTANERRW